MKRKKEDGKWQVVAQKILRTGVLCISLSIFNFQLSTAQHYVGLKAGYGGAQGRFYVDRGKPLGAMQWGKSTAGLVWKYFSPQQVVGGVSVELEFQQRGYTIYDTGDPYYDIGVVIADNESYRKKTRTVSSITLPLIWQPHFYMINRRVRFFLSAGVTVSYNLGINDKFIVTNYKYDPATGKQAVTTTSTDYKMQTARDVRWNYGWLGGAGLSLLVNRWEIFAEGRYYYGMSDILRTKTKYLFNEESSIRSELDNLFVTVGVTFRLGKGGILAPPLSKRRVRPTGDDNFRNIKTGR